MLDVHRRNSVAGAEWIPWAVAGDEVREIKKVYVCVCGGKSGWRRGNHVCLSPRKVDALCEMGSHCKFSNKGGMCSGRSEQDCVRC